MVHLSDMVVYGAGLVGLLNGPKRIDTRYWWLSVQRGLVSERRYCGRCPRNAALTKSDIDGVLWDLECVVLEHQ